MQFKSTRNMFNFFAGTGTVNYTKSARLYLHISAFFEYEVTPTPTFLFKECLLVIQGIDKDNLCGRWRCTLTPFLLEFMQHMQKFWCSALFILTRSMGQDVLLSLVVVSLVRKTWNVKEDARKIPLPWRLYFSCRMKFNASNWSF